MAIADALKIRNIQIIVVVGILMVAHFVITWAFLPLYLSQQRGMDPDTLKWVTGSLGVAAAIYSFAVSGASDRIGRKPVDGVPAVPLGGRPAQRAAARSDGVRRLGDPPGLVAHISGLRRGA
jgi:MFS family permease